MTDSKVLDRATVLLGPALAAVVLLLCQSGPALADWLVLTSGEAVETQGPWTVDGRRIVFTSTRGVLSAVRTTSVDLDSSRAMTAKKQEEAAHPAPAAEQPKREPVLRLTDEDFQPKGEAAAEAGGAGSDRPEVEGPIVVPSADQLETRAAHQLPGSPHLRVTSWSARPTGLDQLSIFGTVENVGTLAAAAVVVSVRLTDSEGLDLGTREAALSATALMPGAGAQLEARFEGNPGFTEVEFTLKSVELEVSPADGGEELEEPVEEQPVGDQPHAQTPATTAAAPPR